jgi:hypothetical protein
MEKRKQSMSMNLTELNGCCDPPLCMDAKLLHSWNYPTIDPKLKKPNLLQIKQTLHFAAHAPVLEVATASSCHWKLHGRIRGYSDENPLNQYDRAVISPYVGTSRK